MRVIQTCNTYVVSFFSIKALARKKSFVLTFLFKLKSNDLTPT